MGGSFSSDPRSEPRGLVSQHEAALATSMMPGLPAGRPAGKARRGADATVAGGRAGHRTGPSGRAIPRKQVALRTHGFGDLISYQNDRKGCAEIADKVTSPEWLCHLVHRYARR